MSTYSETIASGRANGRLIQDLSLRVDQDATEYYFVHMSITTPRSRPTTVTVKGQVTLSKAVREAAGIKPGDKVVSRALPEGGVLIERDPGGPGKEFRRQLQSIAKRRPFRGFTTDEIMKLTRGEE